MNPLATDLPLHEETLDVPLAPGVSVAVQVACPAAWDGTRLLLILPPHPSLGGNRANNVVQALLPLAARRGWLAATCDYRGVADGTVAGESALAYWDRLDATGEYEPILADAAAVLEQVRRAFPAPAPRLALIGYSFGAFLALKLAARCGCESVTALSPPVQELPFAQATPPAGTRVAAIVGTADALAPAAAVRAWAAGAGAQFHLFPCEDHFYRGREDALATQALELAEAHTAPLPAAEPAGPLGYPRETA